MDSRSQSRSPSPGKPVADISGGRVEKFNNGWTKEQEDLMAGWADIAASYRWMHDKGEKKMAKSNNWITIPVIILSTITGSANFMLQSVVPPTDQDAQKYAQIAIGSVSIFTGILTTLGNFFRYAQNSESNRVASIAWGKFQRQVQVELRLHPKLRIDSIDFLNICRSDLDRLIEQSPPIPDDIIEMFEKEHAHLVGFIKPDIAHGMEHTKVFNSKDDRLKQLAVEATAMIKQKRKVWHDAMMPDVERKVQKAMEDISGGIFASMQDRVRQLEEIVFQQKEVIEKDKKRRASILSATHSFSRANLIERGRPATLRRMDTVPLEQQTVHHVVPGSKETSSNDLLSVLGFAKKTSTNPLASGTQKPSVNVDNSISVNIPEDDKGK
jgi:hypothetical protein